MEKDSQENLKTILIIGAGLSGLSAADYLLSKDSNVKIIVLQALDRIGGKTITKQILGTKFDLGAQFIGKNQKYVIQLANRANQQFIPQQYIGQKILFLNGHRSTYASEIPTNVSILALVQLQLSIWKVNRMAKKVPLQNPKLCQMGVYWDSITLQNWIQKNIWSQKVRLLFQVSIRNLLGCQLNQVSFLYFLWFVHQNQSFDNLINIKNGLQQKKLKNGTQELSYYLKSQIEKKNGNIYLNQKVSSVNQSSDKIKVYTQENKCFECNYLILATAPVIYRKIRFQPNLSSQKRHIIQKSFIGKLTKVVILYQKRYWKMKGFSGQIVSDSFKNPILSCFDDTKLYQNGEIKQPALIVFVGAQVYRYWKEKGNLKEKVCEGIAEAFECKQLLKPIAIQYYEFDEQLTIGGGPVGLMGPGLLSHVNNLRKPQGRIHFAGTQLATVSMGYMDGAIQSGIRAANQILERINNGNFHQEFHKINQINNEKNQSPWYNQFVRKTQKCFQWW